jgi:hypothetical protein
VGIDGDIPSYVQSDDDVQDNKRPEPGEAKVQIKTDVEKDKKEGDMEEYAGEAIGGEAPCAGKWPLKVFTVSF